MPSEPPRGSHPDGLREHIAAMADWLDIAADIIHQDRGEALVVGECVKAADAGRRFALITEVDPVAAAVRESLEKRRRG